FLASRRLLDVRNRFCFATLAHDNLACHRAGDQCEPAGLLGIRNHHLTRAKVRGGDTPTSALSAVVTRWAPLVRLRDDREARRNAGNTYLVACRLNNVLGAPRLGWGQENPIRCARHIFFGSKNADVGFNFVVVWRDIFIGDWPVVTHTVSGAGLEVHRRKAQSDPSPVIGSSAHDARAEPAKAGSGSNRVRFTFDLPRAVRSEKLGEVLRGLSANTHTAMRQLIGPDVLLEIFLRVNRRPGLEHDYAQA